MTTLQEELAEQQRWRPRHPDDPVVAYARRVLEHEFLPLETHSSAIGAGLARILSFAAEQVSYYRDLFAGLKIAPGDIATPEDLPLLPELDKTVIRREDARLRPSSLPPGEQAAGWNTSSGTTGTPTRVYRTKWSRFYDLAAEQRQLRWYHFDPAGSIAVVRAAKNLPFPAPGRPIALGETLKMDSWHHVGRHFMTGPFFGFADANATTEKVAWLDRVRPSYVFAMTGELEHLALGFEGDARRVGVRGIRAASEPLTPGIDARIEGTFGAPVHISYGMDEVGWVATRCEAGRYHVYTERFILEIVDEDSKPCAPGKFGRLLLTDTGNDAMPLIRYVTDDIAQALDGPCPCGRTLPSFGPVIGRHSQTKDLAPGTMELVGRLREAMERLPPELSRPLREYQVRQMRSGDFELHLVTAGALASSFSTYIEDHWRCALAESRRAAAAPKLTVRTVDKIPEPPASNSCILYPRSRGRNWPRTTQPQPMIPPGPEIDRPRGGPGGIAPL